MRKYAVDIITSDVLIVKDREVILEHIYVSEDERFIILEGYFEDNGDPFDRQVDADSTYRVRA